MVAPKGFCQLRITIRDKSGKLVPIKKDQWPATFTDFQVYLENNLDWAKVGSGEISIPTWQADGHNGQHAYICPTDEASTDTLIQSWAQFKPKVGNNVINFVASVLAKEEWICQLRVNTWTIPTDPKLANLRAESDVKALTLLNNIPGKWANARLKISATGSGTILAWEPDQVMVDYLKSKWISPSKPDIMNIRWKFDARPHYIHMHDLVKMREKRIPGRVRNPSSSSEATSTDENTAPKVDIVTKEEDRKESPPVEPIRPSLDARLKELTSEADAKLTVNDKKGKLYQLNELMQYNPNKYQGYGYYYDVYKCNFVPMRLDKLKEFMCSHKSRHDGISYYYDILIAKLNIYYVPSTDDDIMEPQLDKDAPAPPRVGSPNKGTIYWQWEGQLSDVMPNINALISFLKKKGAFIHPDLADWLKKWVMPNADITFLLNQEDLAILERAIQKPSTWKSQQK